MDHLPDLLFACRKDAERHVFHQLDHRAAHTKRNDLAKCRIGPSANDQFQARFGLLLDHDSFDLRLGIVALRIVDDSCKCTKGCFFAPDTDHHTAGVALVDDLGRNDLHDNRTTHLLGCQCRVLAVFHDLVLGDRDLVFPQNVISFSFREHLLGHNVTSLCGLLEGPSAARQGVV